LTRLTALVLARPLGGLTVCLCLAALGLVAAWGINVNLAPSTRFPALTVTIILPDAAPPEVETLVTRPLEEEARAVVGVRKVFSLSRSGRAEVTVELASAGQVSAAAQDLRGRLRRLKPTLPRDARPPVISQYSPSEQPAAVLGVTGDASLAAAGDWARDTLAPRLRRVEGLADVRVSGAPEPEIMVDLDPARLRALGLTSHQVALAVRKSSLDLPAGVLLPGEERLPLRVAGQVQDAEQVAALPLAGRPGGGVITVGELGTVQQSHRDPQEITRLGGEPVVTLALYQAGGANLGRLWSQVEEVLAELAPAGGGGPRVEVIYSQAQMLDQALGRLGWMALMAAGAAAAVLYLFLRHLASTLAVLAAVPFSLAVALLLVRLMGLELDVISLSGLALALGILVDNAVVVIEAAHHHWQAGLDRRAGLVAGVAEVASPIAFSTLTTVGGFLPLLLVSEKVRLSMGGFFWGLSLSLVSSLLAALVLVPLLLLFTGGQTRPGPAFRAPAWYQAALAWGLRRPGMVALAAALALAAAGLMAPGLSFRKGSSLETRGFSLLVVLPPGTAKATTSREMAGLEARLAGVAGVERVHSQVWGSQGRVIATLAPEADELGALARAEEALPKPGQGPAQLHLLPLHESGEQATLSVHLTGPDLDGLMAWQNEVSRALHGLKEVKDVVVRMGSPIPELEIALDHRRLGQMGLKAGEVAEEVRAHLTGPVAARIPRGEQELEVRVRGREVETLAALQSIYLPTAGGGSVPLAEVATTRLHQRYPELMREDLRRAIRLTLVLKQGDALAAAGAVAELMSTKPPPTGYAWQLGEEVERLRATRREMLTGAALALVLVYLIMVAATESFLGPLVVLCSAPLAGAGVVAALTALGMAVDMPVYLGGIILVGLVVNVGLVMLDAMNRLGREGLDPAEAARLGALRRLRPVLMTTLGTGAASLPLLLDRGVGSGAWAPLALTLAAGLVVSACFSLVLTPALYPLAAHLESRWHPGKQPEKACNSLQES
jgi:HAE1 family hydrophobic/amphiphilic exporter-1